MSGVHEQSIKYMEEYMETHGLTFLSNGNREVYLKWLRNLKPGDEVCYEYGDILASKRKIKYVKVERITPSGWIKTTDGKYFYTSGQMRGGIYYEYLNPVTRKVKELDARRRAANFLNDFDFHQLDAEDLYQVLSIVQKTTG